jgi:hypothetical protein
MVQQRINLHILHEIFVCTFVRVRHIRIIISKLKVPVPPDKGRGFTHLCLCSVEWMTVFTFSSATLLSEYTSTLGGFILVEKAFVCFPGLLTASTGSRRDSTPTSWFRTAFVPPVCDVTDTVLAEPSEQNESLLFDSLVKATNQHPTLA